VHFFCGKRDSYTHALASDGSLLCSRTAIRRLWVYLLQLDSFDVRSLPQIEHNMTVFNLSRLIAIDTTPSRLSQRRPACLAELELFQSVSIVPSARNIEELSDPAIPILKKVRDFASFVLHFDPFAYIVGRNKKKSGSSSEGFHSRSPWR
jgi:hypothetical protein